MSKEKDHNIIFLFGAGASVEAGVCTSDKITEILVNYGSYCPSENSAAIENLLKYVQVKIADFLQVRASDVNFEYILGTLMELVKREEYPIVPLLGEGDTLVKKLEEKISLNEVIDKLFALLRELLFIRNPVDYLYPLKNFLDLSKPLDIFTLNYDLTLETAFHKLNIPYTTGYRKRKKSLPIWDPAEFGKKSPVVRIFKLHGSVDWGHFFKYQPPPTKNETNTNIFEVENYIRNYPERVTFDPFPVGIVEPPERTKGMVSLMNFGTRKEILYASTQFTVLFNHFLNTLQKAKICLIVGYSFRDQRINKIIEEAVVTRKGDLRLIVVNPSMFWIGQENPVLKKFMHPMLKPLGEALRDGSLLAAAKSSAEAKAEPIRIAQEMSVSKNDSAHQQQPVDLKRILKAWRILGTDFDLTYFWIKFLASDLRELKDSVNESNAIKVGHLLTPLIRKVRDLCYHIRWVYEEMHFGGTYGEEYIETIKVTPKLTDDFSHMDLVRKWLPELGRAVSLVFNTYNGTTTDEFKRAVTDSDYGKDIEAPNHLSAIELVITRKTKNRIYELAWLINEIYKGAGYEEPFEMIAKHQAQLTTETEEVLQKRKEHKNAKKGSSKGQEKRKNKHSTKKK
jgi:hypothetical protein